MIEAIVEKASAKIDLFRQLVEINPINTLFVSNTSSISINLIAGKLQDPFRFAGMHFFNPATYMKLVEIVKADQTSDTLINMLQEVVSRMGKTAVVCKDSPGFIVNRVARHFYLESLQLLEQGKADIETIDQVLEATGFKMGAFRLMDLIGIDINYAVSQHIWEGLGKPVRLKPSSIQDQKIILKKLGKKTEYNIEKGFHSYSNYNNASGWIECSIIKCIIPKGSTYYLNPVRQEYVSDKIKIGKYNEINIKPINIFLDVFNYLLYKIKMIL